MRARSLVIALLAGALALLMGGPARGAGLLERPQPEVERGLRAYEKGEFTEALRLFDEAKQKLPDSARVEFNRGVALYKLGRLEEAKAAFGRAAEVDTGELQGRDYYNLGNAWAGLHDDRQAIRAFRRALVLNPADEQARHNLEVLLRKPPPPDGGTDGGTTADGGMDGGMDGGASGDGGTDGGSPREGQDGGAGGSQSRPDGGADGGSPEQKPSKKSEAPEDGGIQPEPMGSDAQPDGGISEGNLSKREAEKLLDAMKQSEKNLQLWKFQKKKPRRTREKDW